MTMNKAYFTGMKLVFLFLLFFAVLRVSAQDNITLPSSDWEKVDNGDGTFTVKYKGNKYVRNVRVVVLPQTVTLSPETLTLEVGETEELTPEFYPDFENVDKRVTWESNKTSVATVDESGIVTAVSPGTATITVKTVVNEKTAEITVTVPVPSFSVSATKKVVFSKGNLQYHCKNRTWRFAEHQSDIISEGNSDISETYDGWIDLFGWGSGNNPINVSMDDTDYPSFIDWNPNIGDGFTWQTLSSSEWNYLLNTRTTASGIRYAKVQQGQNGLLILPDSWNSSVYSFQKTNTEDASYEWINATDWEKLESSGAIFLPVGMNRDGTSTAVVGIFTGQYWTSTPNGSSEAYYLFFYYDNWMGERGSLDLSTDNRHYGKYVRLVREAE